jgi:regulator of sigma E protease
MSIFIAILGLGFLILIHEAGHFFASLAVGLRPRKFYIGFPPPLVRKRWNGIEYGIGLIPLGGFVSIPGMHRPIPHDAERRFARAKEEEPALAGPADRVARALEGDDLNASLSALDDFEAAMRERKLSSVAAASAAKGLTELRDSLGPNAYWKAPTWKRLVAIAAGPAANIVLALVLFTFLFMSVSGQPSQTILSVNRDSPAEKAGLRPGDRVVAIDGAPVSGEEVGERIVESQGKPLVLTVVRGDTEVEIGPVAPAKSEDGVYRLGIVREGMGLPPVDAVWRAFEVTGIVTKEIVKSLGRLATGEGRENVSSPIGITQASSDAVERGAENYLWVLGLISLSLALLNLLPLLPLDGGHVLFTLIEGARGRFVQREVYERVSVVGLAVVLLLFFIGLSNDIGRLS